MNGQERPRQVDSLGQTLKSIAGVAAFLTGVYVISNLGTFRGRAYQTPGLTDDQINAMDKHNDHHHWKDIMHTVLQFVLGTKVADPLIKEDDVQTRQRYDTEVSNLPLPLNHTH